MGTPWPPNRYLPDYTGDYPRHELEAARQTLITCLLYNRSEIIERVKPKIGLSSSYGPAQIPPPVPLPPPTLSPSPQRQHQLLNSTPPGQRHSAQTDMSTHRVNHLPHTAPHSTVFLDPDKSPNMVNNTSFDGTGHRQRGHLVPIPRADSEDTETDINNAQPVTAKRKLSIDDDEEENVEERKRPKVVFSIRPVSTKTAQLTGEEVASETRSKTVVEETAAQLVYKCDFCSFTCLLSAQMNEHLTNTQHFSGSIYCAESTPDSATGYTLLSIHKMLAVKNKFNKAKALVVVCPECKDIYEDIFMCGMHYKYKHGTPNGFYSICPVIYHETVTVPVEPVCAKCEEIFPRQKVLHSHWSQFPNHHPIAKPANERVFVLFICPYCQKTFYNNFLNCKSHVITKHQSNGAVSRGVMAIEVKHVLLPMRKEELPAFNTSDQSDGIQDELTILRNMKRHFREMSAQKSKLLEITTRIKHLRTLNAGPTAGPAAVSY